ncbi:hypothetical protein KGF56_001805 [Candida oxycetoniae]|uniref:Uncharacterized protein n=1 Tax=Candida oxycetoniae TaxID=497107 RepID=A0AAI9WYU4_9ASCO|nr:uncharacterized protein KGF56_001805 [Candida oxycetoniae]KAI3405409.2 hypothetical protein KGF56_001805 [Candida oxycetoniae]
MNITSDAYYTPEYLYQKKRQLEQSLRYQTDQRYYASTPREYMSVSTRHTKEMRSASASASSSATPSKKPVMKNIRPKVVPATTPSPLNLVRNGDEVEIEYECDSDDQLREELTPAQLTAMQNKFIKRHCREQRRISRSRYDDHFPYDSFERQVQSPQQSLSRRKVNQNNDYYLKQKQRFDVADTSLKPKLYTHKTFREVFEDKTENKSRYNPMDIVFDKKEGEYSSSDGSKKRLLSGVKFMKDKYNDYDYYENRIRKSESNGAMKNNSVSSPVSGGDHKQSPSGAKNTNIEKQSPSGAKNTIIEKQSPSGAKKTIIDGGNKEGKSKGESIFVSGDDEEPNTKINQARLKQLLKKKLKQASKELGRDFDSYIDEAKKQKIVDKIVEKLVEGEVKEEEKPSVKPKKEEGETKKKEEKKAEKEEKVDVEVEVVEEKTNKCEPTSLLVPCVNYIKSWFPVGKQDEKEVTIPIDKPDVQSKQASSTSKELVPIKAASPKTATAPAPTPPPPPPSTTPAAPPDNAQLLKNPRIKKFTRGSKLIFANWNEPAIKMFNGNLAVPQKNSKPSLLPPPESTSISHIVEDTPTEFIIELDSENEEIESMSEELYYNPTTKQLETQPPPSSSASSHHTLAIEGAPSSQEQLYNLIDTQKPIEVISNLITMLKKFQIMRIIFSPIDVFGDFFPNLQMVVLIVELLLFMWILFELSRLIDALCIMIKAICAPMIAVGRFMNKIM